MGFKVGTPIVLLRKDKTKNKKHNNKRNGTLRKLVEEMMEERKSKDKKIKKELTKYNTYYSPNGRITDFTSEGVIKYYEEFRDKYKELKGRNLRSDAPLGANMIAKINSDYLNTLPAETQEKLVKDLRNVYIDILTKHGLNVDLVVTHRDEHGIHDHILFSDDEYRLSNKVNSKLKGDLNREIPKKLRQLGYECDDLDNYDFEKAKEDDEYGIKRSKKRKEQKKQHQLSTDEYRDFLKATKEKQLEDKANNLSVKAAKIASANTLVRKRYEVLKNKEQALKERIKALKSKEKTLSDGINENKRIYNASTIFIQDIYNLAKSKLSRKDLKVLVQNLNSRTQNKLEIQESIEESVETYEKNEIKNFEEFENINYKNNNIDFDL